MTAPRLRAARDPGTRLVAAILADGQAAGCEPVLVTLDQRDWASATFVGLRQHIVVAVPPGPARSAWLARLPDAELPIPRHVLADLTVTVTVTGGVADPHHVAIETLLLTDR